MVDTSLVFNILARDKTKAGFESIGKTAKVAFFAVGAAAIGAGKVLYDIGETFDEVKDTIRVGTGATGKALDNLFESAKNVGRQVPAEWSDIGPTVADINTRLGLTGKTLETVASQYLEAGRILGEKVDIQSSTAAFNAFKISGDGVSVALDDMFRVSQATGISMNSLSQIVSRNAPILQNLGFSFKDSAAFAGLLDKAGINASQTMMAMSRGLVTLAKDGEKPPQAFQRVTEKIQGFVDEGKTAAAINLASKIFGTRGASQFVGALQSGTIDMRKLMKSVGATSDTILGAGEDTQDFAETWTLLKNRAMAALEPLGSAVFSALGDALRRVLPYLDKVSGWLQRNPAVIGVIAGLIGATLVGAFVAWTASIWAANAALLANPITWVVLAIAGLVAAVVLAWNKFEGFRNVVTAVWGAIQTAIGAVVGWFQDTAWPIIKTVAGYIGAYYRTLFTIAKTVWGGIARAIGAVVGWFRDTAWPVIRTVGGYIGGYYRTLFGIVKGAWNGIKNAIGSVVNWFRDTVQPKIKAVVDVISGIWGGIKTAAIAAFNGIASAWNNTVGSLTFGVPDWVPGIGGRGWDVPDIPMLADGGIVTRPTLAVVGEAGPEAVVPLGRGGFGGPQIVVNVQTLDPRGAGPAVVKALDEAYRTWRLRPGWAS